MLDDIGRRPKNDEAQGGLSIQFQSIICTSHRTISQALSNAQ